MDVPDRAECERRSGAEAAGEVVGIDEFDDRRPEPASAAPGPEESAARGQDLALLRRALDRLPADKREILVLSRFQNMKYEEIAAILGCEPGTVKVRVFRAMRALEQAYFTLRGGEIGMTCEETKLLLTEYWSQIARARTRSSAFEAHIATASVPCGSGAAGSDVEESRADSGIVEGVRAGAEFARRGSTKRWARIVRGWNRRRGTGCGTDSRAVAEAAGVADGGELRVAGDRIRGWLSASLGGRSRVHEAPPATELAQLTWRSKQYASNGGLSLMQQQSAGERLRGVSYAYQAPASDTEVLSALLATVNQDESVGVRLAAVDALHAVRSESGDAGGDHAVDSRSRIRRWCRSS